jgi:hypothetical protein
MSALRGVLLGIADTMVPDGTMTRNRARVTLDLVLTVAITILAIALAIGYQALGRWGSRFFGDAE